MKSYFLSIRFRLIILLGVMVLFPVTLGFYVYARAATSMVQQKLIENQQALLEQAAGGLNRIIGLLNTSINFLGSSTAVERYLRGLPGQSDQLFLEIRGLQQTMQLVSGAAFQHAMKIHLITRNDIVSNISDIRRNRENLMASPWVQTALDNPGRIQWHLGIQGFWTDEGFMEYELITVARAVRAYGNRDTLGVIGVSIDLKDIELLLLPGMGLWADQTFLAGMQSPSQEAREIYKELENGWIVIFAVDPEDFFRDLQQLQTQGLLGMVGLSIILALIISINVLSSTRNLALLQERVIQVQTGDLSVRMPVLPRDEVGLLAGQFNRMLDQIQELIEKIRIEHALAEEAKLAQLRAQIRPHFLLNSLNTIGISARMSGAQNITSMIRALTGLLERSLYEKEAFTLLSTELETTRGYLMLEALRTGDRWQVDMNHEQVTGDPYCPVFCLQPLVENALTHGLPADANGFMHLTIGIQTHRISSGKKLTRIIVEDDGVGFPGDLIRHGLEGLDERESTSPGGIGIKNIHHRIQAHFGMDYGISLDLDHSPGARVIVTFPYLETCP